MAGDVQNCGGVDDLAAHLGGGGVNHGETGGIGVGAVDYAAVHGGLGDLGGDLLYVGAVGYHSGGGQFFLIQAVIGENLLGVLAHRYIGVAHGQQDAAALEPGYHVVIGLYAGGVPLGHRQSHLVLQQVYTGALEHIVLAVGVAALGIQGAVQGVHLLGSGGDEEVAVGPLLYLGLERAGGVEVEDQLHIGGCLFIHTGYLVEGFGHGGGGKDDELHTLLLSALLGGGFGLLGALLHRLLGRSLGLAAAEKAEDHGQTQQQCKDLFHFTSSLFSVVYA